MKFDLVFEANFVIKRIEINIFSQYFKYSFLLHTHFVRLNLDKKKRARLSINNFP